MLEECLYYGNLIKTYGTPNSLRKRLVQSCLEDMCHWDLAIEISKCGDDELEKYVYIVAKNKKTHISAWAQRVALDKAIKKKDESHNPELAQLVKLTFLDVKEDYGAIRKFLGPDGSKLFTYMGKERLVWTVKVLWESRSILKYPLNRSIDDKIVPRKFDTIPEWCRDKHTVGGKAGYQFFFDNSCVMNNRVYSSTEDYEMTCKMIYLTEEAKYGNKARTKHTIERWREQLKKISTGASTGASDTVPKQLIDYGYYDIIQIQLLTRKSNPKVYFCTQDKANGEKKKYVLKGPINVFLAQNIRETERVKKILDQPHLNVKILKISGELWMRSDSLIDYTNDVITKQSKLESTRNIYNGPNANCNFKKNLDKQFMGVMMAVLLKSLVGANDWAERNFITAAPHSKVYSVDDHAKRDPIKELKPKLNKKCSEQWDTLVEKHKQEIQDVLEKWVKTDLVEESFYEDRLEVLKKLMS